MSDWEDDQKPRIHEHTPCSTVRALVTHWVVALPRGTTLGPYKSAQAARAWVEEWLPEEHHKVCLIPVLNPGMVGSLILNSAEEED
jgi:hypothetical protein